MIARMRIEQSLAERGLELPAPERLAPGIVLPFPWVRLWPRAGCGSSAWSTPRRVSPRSGCVEIEAEVAVD
jgi:hypothetical protein